MEDQKMSEESLILTLENEKLRQRVEELEASIKIIQDVLEGLTSLTP